ncbi:indole-3-glycerol phosphate synthase TrpC [Floricoccus penangensis]|uniref:indole-3-glycerol phosphate synthase TrpC n=1 Tax=Floricoccus penangensis TaxID=1859475 RepID=UPI00203EDA15|nr:indole-3-glycerol phosphate synthase TrpC [Floricoccus penangensis]URZ88071.1 indole-3-glycerol phosphate synthase TrpC [Floricoccus penangensis]
MSMDFLDKILTEKRKEVTEMPDEKPGKLRETYKIVDYLSKNSQELQVIAEVKKASPSLGDINTNVDIVAQAKSYEDSGAMAISVLTDQVYFKGNIDYLREISTKVKIPTLNKDFIIDKKQINRAVNNGATVILLIVAALDYDRLKELYDYATGLDLEVLVETHNEKELEQAHKLGAKLIGINNRNLKTFEVTLDTTRKLSKIFQEDRFYISESGIKEEGDAEFVAPYVNGILVGESLMRSSNVEEAIKSLKVERNDY